MLGIEVVQRLLDESLMDFLLNPIYIGRLSRVVVVEWNGFVRRRESRQVERLLRQVGSLLGFMQSGI